MLVAVKFLRPDKPTLQHEKKVDRIVYINTEEIRSVNMSDITMVSSNPGGGIRHMGVRVDIHYIHGGSDSFSRPSFYEAEELMKEILYSGKSEVKRDR